MGKREPSPGHDLIVIGASSGGIEALIALLGWLPADLAAALCIVVHTSPEAPGLLPAVLGRRTPLPVSQAIDGERLQAGHIYVARPDHHLLVESGRIRVTRGPRENRHRPAVDPLFRSAALTYGPRTIGVVLSGALDDGTAGLAAIKNQGGIAIVQDPEEALFPGMPASAQRHVPVDYALPAAAIGPLLARLAREPASQPERAPAEALIIEERYAREEGAAMDDLTEIGMPTALTCPECHGPLWEVGDRSILRFRCRTGHAFTAESVMAGQSVALEDALWMAVNTLQESALVAEQLAKSAEERHHEHVAARFAAKARESRRQARVIRTVIEGAKAEAALDEETSTIASL